MTGRLVVADLDNARIHKFEDLGDKGKFILNWGHEDSLSLTIGGGAATDLAEHYETQAAQKFRGEIDDVEVTVHTEIGTAFDPGAVDSFQGTVSYGEPVNTEYSATFTETGNDTNEFTAEIEVAEGTGGGTQLCLEGYAVSTASGPGTFTPIVLRVHVPDELAAEHDFIDQQGMCVFRGQGIRNDAGVWWNFGAYSFSEKLYYCERVDVTGKKQRVFLVLDDEVDWQIEEDEDNGFQRMSDIAGIEKGRFTARLWNRKADEDDGGIQKDAQGNEIPDEKYVHTYALTAAKIGFRDILPDYSGDSNEDSDNFFLRQDNDHNIEIYFRILPDDLEVDSVKINIYPEDSSTPIVLGENEGVPQSGGDDLHCVWDAKDGNEYRDKGYFRVQLEMKVKGVADAVKTPIKDADPETPGWQCPNEGLAVHDLIWKHRPIVNIHTEEWGAPSTVDEFIANSKMKEWLAGQDEPHEYPAGFFPSRLWSFLDLFDDDVRTHGDLADFTAAQREVLRTNADARAIYTSANTEDAANFVFLQYWMFENYSCTPPGTPWYGETMYHEGDVEYVQIAVRLQDAPNALVIKSRWLMPFGATAAQHYYGQTLKWNTSDGSPVNQAHVQEHVEHTDGRLVIHIARNSHATYFASDSAIDVPSVNRVMGTQEQYDPTPEFAYDVTFPGTTIDVDFLLLQSDVRLSQWVGRWGYIEDRDDLYNDKNGPPGPPLRYQLDAGGNEVVVIDNPRTIHNACRKTSQWNEMEIP